MAGETKSHTNFRTTRVCEKMGMEICWDEFRIATMIIIIIKRMTSKNDRLFIQRTHLSGVYLVLNFPSTFNRKTKP